MIQVKNTESNYLARIVKLSGLRRHAGADRLQCCNILNNNVITDLKARDGDIYVFFPVESKVNAGYLSFTNSFAAPELNKDKVKGFCPSAGRIKAILLRKERSEGYILPIKSFEDWLNSIGINFEFKEEYLDKDFDTVKDVLICEKYVVPTKGGPSLAKNKAVKPLRQSKLVENQFRLPTQKVSQLKREVNRINPNDLITISVKYHGAAWAAGKVLCKKKLSLWDKIGKFLRFSIVDTQYDLLWASHHVVKNKFFDSRKNTGHYYSEDVWGILANKYKDSIKDGITLYGECIGFTPTQRYIQRDYDYGITPGESEAIIFRITMTNASGDVFEFSTDQVSNYCEKNGLKRAEILYQGRAKDLFPDLSPEEHWHQNFLKKLEDKYLEKDCHICRNKVPNEGIIISLAGDTYQPLKYKSFRFVSRESELLDAGVGSIEDDDGEMGYDEEMPEIPEENIPDEDLVLKP